MSFFRIEYRGKGKASPIDHDSCLKNCLFVVSSAIANYNSMLQFAVYI